MAMKAQTVHDGIFQQGFEGIAPTTYIFQDYREISTKMLNMTTRAIIILWELLRTCQTFNFITHSSEELLPWLLHHFPVVGIDKCKIICPKLWANHGLHTETCRTAKEGEIGIKKKGTECLE
jgi:hypothetical protein